MYDLPSFCDLIQAVAASRGVSGIPLTRPGEDLLHEIGEDELLVFVLIDGLGKTILEKLSPGSFLRSMYKRDLLSVFPSTTACAMTSLATGLHPSEHGIPGRYAYVEERDIHTDTLAFRDREYKKLLSPETSIEDLWPYPPLISRIPVQCMSVVPQVLHRSAFDCYLAGTTLSEGYTDIPSAAEMIMNAASNGDNGYLFLYMWDLDSLCHKIGPHEPEVDDMLQLIDQSMERLAEALTGRGRMVITADHGHMHIEDHDRHIFTDSHPVMEFARTAPFGEPRALQFLVKPGTEELFAQRFHEHWGDVFTLYSKQEAETARLFGGTSFSLPARKRFGDFIAVARDRGILLYDNPRFTPSRNRGEHGGNLPEERIIPLLVSG